MVNQRESQARGDHVLRGLNTRRDKLNNTTALPTMQVVVVFPCRNDGLVPDTTIAKVMAGRYPRLHKKLQRTIHSHVTNRRKNNGGLPHHLIDGHVAAARQEHFENNPPLPGYF